jgi:hypothetical protein
MGTFRSPPSATGLCNALLAKCAEEAEGFQKTHESDGVRPSL